MPGAAAPQRSALRRRVHAAASLLTTPLLPADYLGLIDRTWAGRGLAARIVGVRPETADAATVVLRPGPGWPGHRPGQHVALGVEIDGVRHTRTFSLTSAPGAREVAVTVKAQPDGLVSAHLVRDARPGDLVHLSAPDGDFVLPDAPLGPALFLAAGSGITPIAAMLRAARVRDAVLVRCDRNPADVIFGAELRALAAAGLTLHERLTAREGRLTAEQLAALVPDWEARETWACGPAGLLDTVADAFAAAGASERLHVERFHAQLFAQPAGAGGTVTFRRSGRTIDVEGGTPLLLAAERAGVPLRSGCRMGTCRTCAGTLVSGQVRDLLTGDVHGAPGDMVRACVSGAAGPAVLDL